MPDGWHLADFVDFLVVHFDCSLVTTAPMR
jgi:hypothetical protein